MISALLSKVFVLLFGTLYPAYASYKTVKTKNVRDYVKWMMYWIVFALYNTLEIFTDIFLSFWFPFYYELKIIFIIWLVCPATRGSTFVFRKLINPHLSKHEKVIDANIASFWEQGYVFIKSAGAQGKEFLLNLFFDLLRAGQVRASQFMPKVEESTDTDSTHERPFQRSASQVMIDENALDEEDFAVLMEENPDLYNDAIAASRQHRAELSEDLDSESGPEVKKSTKSRPLKVTKGKSRTGLRERKKKNAED